MIRRSPPAAIDLDAAAHAAARVVITHQRLAEFIRPGRTLAQIDAEVARVLASLQSRSCFLGYRQGRLPPFPSHACLSVNDCIVHGTAASLARPLHPGDLLSLDIGLTHRGHIGDAAWTYAIAHADENAARLMTAGKDALRLGIAALQPGRPLRDFALAVQTRVERDDHFHCVRGLGGHGYGRTLHAPPYIANVVPTQPAEWPEASNPVAPGMLLAVEPMIAVGTAATRQPPAQWPIATADGSLSVHYEADVLITPDGPRNLTQDMFQLPDVLN